MSDRPRRLRVFAVEPDAVQLTWGRLGHGPVEVRVVDAGIEHTVDADGGPGALMLTGLGPGRTYVVEVGATRLTARTPTPPPGAELFRFATLSDAHLGMEDFGLLSTMREQDVDEHHPVRCFRAGLAEAEDWGARHLLLKGDIVNRGTIEEYELLGELLAESRLPVTVVPGNHETKSHREVDHVEGFARLGLDSGPGVRTVDLPGLRLGLIDSTMVGRHRGRLHHVIDEVGDALDGRPSMVALHHQLLRLPVPTSWPPGVPSVHANRFLDVVAEAVPTAVVVSGHTHRHRTRHHRNVVVAETGSPKDHPGTWTGYVVHEGGIRQVVRRVARPDCIRWTEYTRWAALGVWGHWSPGTLRDRCWVHEWPPGERTAG